jgi:Putative transposase
MERSFDAYLAPLRDTKWVVYVKNPFRGPGQVLRYMARCIHLVAIANSRLVAIDRERLSFRWKDYRWPGSYQGYDARGHTAPASTGRRIMCACFV